MIPKHEMSDLWFNHQHDHYQRLFGDPKNPPQREHTEAAIRLDAEEFSSSFPSVMELANVDVEWLVAEFFNRL